VNDPRHVEQVHSLAVIRVDQSRLAAQGTWITSVSVMTLTGLRIPMMWEPFGGPQECAARRPFGGDW